ncbi:hypothetical protein [Flavihumibacter solisilvae]|uniref:Uncharacterized protein n=1 Tax=Flavihumibacter solisilvae TaxID=1349421 RepID=A0A0C1L5T5_9BACT|nr:hypothetical protein [Flavihumibacter solisilvae]KIC94871.1 hypothetical protein OI18_08100 [Flavihumibacter solisilvae]
MKKLPLLLFIVITTLNISTFAQSNKEDIDIIQSAFGKDKKVLIGQVMQIAAKDSVAFWKLYDEYEAKRKALGRERIGLLQQYADQYDKLDDAKAAQLASSAFANDSKYNNLYQAYFKKFSSVIGGKKSAELFQLETYLQNLTRLYIMNNIPFIGELDKSKVPVKGDNL